MKAPTIALRRQIGVIQGLVRRESLPREVVVEQSMPGVAEVI